MSNRLFSKREWLCAILFPAFSFVVYGYINSEGASLANANYKQAGAENN